MKIVVVVQARVQSTRLPAKVLLDLGGVTALERCLSRARRIHGVHSLVVATSDGPADDLIERVSTRLGHDVVRGSESDVLSRFAKAARLHDADAVVRLTSDCPLLDVAQSSEVVSAFVRERPDYASNVLDRRLPRGLDTEVMTRAALERADGEAIAADEREHVTLHLVRRPQTFKLHSVVRSSSVDLAWHRWTLDTLDDYRFLHSVFEALGPRAADASMDDVLRLLEARPDLVDINAHVEQKRT